RMDARGCESVHQENSMRPLVRLLGATAASAICATSLPAQRAVTAPATYAITNARLVPVSGPVIEKGSIVVRDGIIVAVGANVAIPGDARIIDGNGLSVYPGLIDAYGSLGLPASGSAQTQGGRGGRAGGGGGQQASEGRQGAAPNSNYP